MPPIYLQIHPVFVNQFFEFTRLCLIIKKANSRVTPQCYEFTPSQRRMVLNYKQALLLAYSTRLSRCQGALLQMGTNLLMDVPFLALMSSSTLCCDLLQTALFFPLPLNDDRHDIQNIAGVMRVLSLSSGKCEGRKVSLFFAGFLTSPVRVCGFI